MTCDHCTEPAIAVEPGCEGIHELFLLKRPEPRRQWCAAHWPPLQLQQQQAEQTA